MKFINIAAIAILQTAKVASAANALYGIPNGGDAKVSCEAAGDQCCSSSRWTSIDNTGTITLSEFALSGCEVPVSQGTYVGCVENTTAPSTGCTVECSSGCVVDTTPLTVTTTAATASTVTADTETTTTTTTTAASTAAAEVPASATADGFTPIDGDFSTIVFVSISPSCPWDSTTSYPNAVFTIQPSTVAYVSSFPANLVTSSVTGNVLTLDWNSVAAAGATSGGVRIGLPADQFNKLYLGSALRAQILNGFTSVGQVDVGGASTLKATLTSNTNPDLALNVGGASTASVITSAVGSASVGGASTLTVQADSVSNISANGASTLAVSGNVAGGSVGGASTVGVSGDISGSLSNIGASTINANTISGSIDNSQASTVNAASCTNVQNSMAASCNVRGAPTVTVDVSQYGAISTSTCECSGFFKTCGNGSSLGSSTSFAIAAVTGATTLVAFLLM
mmetsp:Transcript_11737/g.18062  ORF Transcript_11737/g.18062 Transcript_11737/m.18062 type:complete len:454 (+) Transcript_11737:45-1406(+)